MPFKRTWDSSCPRIWSSWEDAGEKWLIQDLAPEDDEAALEILIETLLRDETLCSLTNLYDDEESKLSMSEFWRACFAQRMSLGCYVEVDGKRTLGALNACVVDTVEERVPDVKIEGEAWRQVYGALEYAELKLDAFKYLDVDTILHSYGLVVKREYRGRRLGSKILAARERLCAPLSIIATATVFTGTASQISAARAGFDVVAVTSLKELADHGFKYPKDENRFLKLMVKNSCRCCYNFT